MDLFCLSCMNSKWSITGNLANTSYDNSNNNNSYIYWTWTNIHANQWNSFDLLCCWFAFLLARKISVFFHLSTFLLCFPPAICFKRFSLKYCLHGIKTVGKKCNLIDLFDFDLQRWLKLNVFQSTVCSHIQNQLISNRFSVFLLFLFSKKKPKKVERKKTFVFNVSIWKFIALILAYTNSINYDL